MSHLKINRTKFSVDVRLKPNFRIKSASSDEATALLCAVALLWSIAEKQAKPTADENPSSNLLDDEFDK